MSGAILPRKSFPTFLSDISIIEKRGCEERRCHSVGAGVLDSPRGAKKMNVEISGENGDEDQIRRRFLLSFPFPAGTSRTPSPTVVWKHFWIVVRLYHVAALRAADSCPYGDAGTLSSRRRGGACPARRHSVCSRIRPGAELKHRFPRAGGASPSPTVIWVRFHITVRLYRDAGLRAAEGIGPY